MGSRTKRASLAVFAGLVCVTGTDLVLARGLHLPNGSFESPMTEYVGQNIDGWQKSPQPGWWDPNLMGASWDQLAGVFLNTPPGSADHIVNCDGAQAAFLFALPQVGIFQDYNSTDWANPSPTHAFDATFEAGKSYTLNVGVMPGNGISPGATLEASLYYRDDTNNPVTVAKITIANTSPLFTDSTHFVNLQVQTAPVNLTNLWAGKHIGVQILSTVGFDHMGGYWDLDNVRLSETIEIPNGSFESVATDFADPRIDAWEKPPQPIWWDPSHGAWDQVSGVFLNTAPGSPDHIVNCDGAQAAFLFALPQSALWQDYNSTNWAAAVPTHAFNVKFKPGLTYILTVGVIGGGGGMLNGATLELSLYYRDGAGNMITIAATTVTNTPAIFSNTTQLVDFQVVVPTVRPSAPWANQNVGIQILSTVGFDLMGGYWDLDKVRLSEFREPAWLAPTQTSGRFQATLQSDPGAAFEVLVAANPALPRAQWTTLKTLTNVTGTNTVTDTSANGGWRFYQVRQLP